MMNKRAACILSAIALICQASLVGAEHSKTIRTSNTISIGDTVELVSRDHCRSAELRYTNNADEISVEGKWRVRLVCGDASIEVEVEVVIGGRDLDYRETAIILPAPPFLSEPPEVMAHDGETVTSAIFLPMF